jgi:hypothetical protein
MSTPRGSPVDDSRLQDEPASDSRTLIDSEIERILNCRTVYSILGVPERGMTRREVRMRFNKLARTLHPDKSIGRGTMNPNTVLAFSRLKAAYDALMNDIDNPSSLPLPPVFDPESGAHVSNKPVVLKPVRRHAALVTSKALRSALSESQTPSVVSASDSGDSLGSESSKSAKRKRELFSDLDTKDMCLSSASGVSDIIKELSPKYDKVEAAAASSPKGDCPPALIAQLLRVNIQSERVHMPDESRS